MGLFPQTMTRFRRKVCVTLTALTLFILVVLKTLFPDDGILVGGFGMEMFPQEMPGDGDAEIHVMPETSMIKKIWKEKVVNVFNRGPRDKDFPPPNYNVHVFYYTWYGNPQFDGKYIHWNHPLLQHWNPKVAPGYATGTHKPPDDIGASFYPALGAYSSRDPSVIEVHMQQLRTAAIGVLAVSWYPPGMKDDNGEPTEDIVPLILEVAAKYSVKVVFHIEPYRGRNDETTLENIKYIIENALDASLDGAGEILATQKRTGSAPKRQEHHEYGEHPAFFRHKSSTGKLLPLFYIYDSYLQSPDIWAQLLKSTGMRSIRNTPYDAVVIGLLVEEKHKAEVLAAGFDGIYTYFATNSFSYGSSQQNWRSIKAFCDSNNLIFIPSVGPGYIDTSIRPWNSQNTRNRINGKYYETSLKAALETKPEIISVTSFNEWHEGTQIETAIPKTRGQTAYLDYLPYKPTMYLDITRRWAEKFREEPERKLLQ